MNKRFKIGRFEFHLMDRMTYKVDGTYQDGAGFFGYISWCYPSETLFFHKWELNIQNRRKPQ